MAVRWLRTAYVPLLLASLCCISLVHGRIIAGGLDLSSLPSAKVRELQREGVELDSEFNRSIVSEYTAPMKGDVKGFSPSIGKIVRSIGDTDSARQSGDHSVSVILGKWTRTLGKIAEWILHACVVVLALCVIFYTISCVYACCVGLDLLAEIWRRLGGWQAFSYFVRVEQAVAETDPEPLPLLPSAAEP